MRYWQPSTKVVKELPTTAPFWTLQQINLGLEPKDYWSFADYGTAHVSAYSTVQGPTDRVYVWLNDEEKWSVK